MTTIESSANLTYITAIEATSEKADFVIIVGCILCFDAIEMEAGIFEYFLHLLALGLGTKQERDLHGIKAIVHNVEVLRIGGANSGPFFLFAMQR